MPEPLSRPPATTAEVALVARVRPHDEAAYLRYVAETYAPALAQMPGFVSLRVLRWHQSTDPAATPRGDAVEFLRISTWASRAAADAYYASPVRGTFGRLLELAEVLAYGEAEVVVAADGDAPEADAP